MRFAFTEEQLLFRDSLRELLTRECPPSVVRGAWERGEGERPAIWKSLAELGVTGLSVPEAHGGLGLGPVELVLLLEEAGRAALPAPLIETTAVAVPLLLQSADASLCNRWLPAIATGDAILGLQPPHSGFVADADLADWILVSDGEALYGLPPERCELVPQNNVDGSRRLFRVEWSKEQAQRIASVTDAEQALAAAFDHGGLGCAASLLGVATKMLDLTVAYVKEREQFGRPIGSFQAIKHQLANALLALQFARPAVYGAAWTTANDPDRRSLDVSLAKARANDAATLTAKVALQCHGAIGYAFEHDLHLWMKRAWALTAAWGDGAWHRNRIGEHIL